MSKHQTIYVSTVTVIDPQTKGEVEVEIRKDLVTGAMVGLDGSYLSQDIGPVYDPYNAGDELIIPDDEDTGFRIGKITDLRLPTTPMDDGDQFNEDFTGGTK